MLCCMRCVSGYELEHAAEDGVRIGQTNWVRGPGSETKFTVCGAFVAGGGTKFTVLRGEWRWAVSSLYGVWGVLGMYGVLGG